MTTIDPTRIVRNCRQGFFENFDFNFWSDDMTQVMGKGSGWVYPFPKDSGLLLMADFTNAAVIQPEQ